MSINDTPRVLYGVRQIRIVPLLATGAPSPGLAWYVGTEPQEVGISGVYDEGEIAQLRGGDALVCEIIEDDKMLGFDLSLKNAKFTPEITKLIVGGLWIESVDSPPTIIGWYAPLNNAAQPRFKFECWVQIWTQARPAVTDGFMSFSFPFCRGRFSSNTVADREFANPEFDIEARQNPYDDARSVTWERVAALP